MIYKCPSAALISIGSAVYLGDHFLRKIQNFISTIKAFSAGINAGKQIAALDSHIFDKELKSLLPVLKKLKRKPALMDIYVDVCLMQSPSLILLGFVTASFGIFGVWVSLGSQYNKKQHKRSHDTL
jgi:hypothetical protein